MCTVQRYGDNFQNANQVDEFGSSPVRLDVVQTEQLRLLFLKSSHMRSAMTEMKNMLFSFPFEAKLGKTEGAASLNPTVKDALIEKYWMPELRNMYDWIVQFGISPYFFQPALTPIFVDYHHREPMMDKLKTRSDYRSRLPVADAKYFGERQGYYDLRETYSKKAANEAARKRKRGGRLDLRDERGNEIYGDGNDRGDEKDDEDDGGDRDGITNREERHDVLKVPSFDSGFISTYVDGNGEQQFLWTWNPWGVPPGYDSELGYTDPAVGFVLGDPPTILGKYANALATSIDDWTHLGSRKKIDLMNMRDKLNPLLFVEKSESRLMCKPSSINETAVGYSSGFNIGGMNGTGIAGGGNYEIDPSGNIITADGRAYVIDTTRVDGFTDAGIVATPDRWMGSSFGRSDQFQSTHRRAGSMRSGGKDALVEKDYNFGGSPGDSVATTDLSGTLTVQGDEPVFTNSMSGVSVRVKRLGEGEKVVKVGGNEMDVYANSVSVELQETKLDEKLCLLCGIPLSYIVGGGSGSGNIKQGKGSKVGFASISGDGKSLGGGSGSGASKTESKIMLKSLKHQKAFYETKISKLFEECYKSAFDRSKAKSLRRSDYSTWGKVISEHSVAIDLCTTPPPLDEDTLTSAYSLRMVTTKEFVKNYRLSMGLSLDVLNDPVFMANASKTLDDALVLENGYKLKAKYETKKEGGASNKPKAKSKAKSKEKTKVSKSKTDGGSKKRKPDGGKESASKKQKTTAK
jgi:hypothetical protein